MTPLIFNLGPTELIIILVIILLLFGGSRLAGLGKSTGRALKEFKEETRDLGKKDETPQQSLPNQNTGQQPSANQSGSQDQWQQPPTQNVSDGDVRRDA